MKENYLTMHDSGGKLLMKVTRNSNRLYKIQLKVGTPICLQAKIDKEPWLWHARLGHINFASLNGMYKMAEGVPVIREKNQLCESCMVGKQTRHSFPKKAKFRASAVLELVHGDLCGPISPPTLTGNKYILVLIDDFSRYMWSYLLKQKSDAFVTIKKFKVMIEKQTRKPLKTLRTDRGGEFTSREFNEYCEQEGVMRHLTAPYTPQQNGVVERRNRTLVEMTRCIMKARGVPNYLWGEAVRHASYLINRTPTRALVGETPYEKFKRKKPNLEHLKIFGCLAYERVVSKQLQKLDDRSNPLVHLGFEPGSGAYRLYDPKTQRIIVSVHVDFDEKRGWNWKEDNTVECKTQRKPGLFTVMWGDYEDNGPGPHLVSLESSDQSVTSSSSGESRGSSLENDATTHTYGSSDTETSSSVQTSSATPIDQSASNFRGPIQF
ncbi:putative RNA-directed DNA polymerase [Helianthus annuus]|nr:putative RNA-directed DNA polymerase [Helianthus annuus]